MPQPITATKTLHLRHPVKIGSGRGGLVYRKLELRCPTFQEFARMKKDPVGIDGVLLCLALVAGVPQNVVERLCPRDFFAACDWMSQWEVGDDDGQ
jgi:hypothetical protein